MLPAVNLADCHRCAPLPACGSHLCRFSVQTRLLVPEQAPVLLVPHQWPRVLTTLAAHLVRRRFIIVAPDSHNKDQWYTPNAGQAFTSDFEHIEACFQYVKNLGGVRINSRWVVSP